MDYFLTEDQKEIKKLARRIAEERVMPVRAAAGRDGDIPLGDHAGVRGSGSFRREHTRKRTAAWAAARSRTASPSRN